ncbi:MAG: DUF2079 domain-containing protein [Acidobacteriaceae bacterium]
MILLLWTLGGLRYWWSGGAARGFVLAATLLLLAAGAWQLNRWWYTCARWSTILWIYLLAEFLPEQLLGGSKTWMPQVVPALMALSWIAVASLAEKPAGEFLGRVRTLGGRHALPLLAGFSVVYLIAGCGLALRKLHCFGYVGQDVAYFMQCLYTGVHGHLFWSNQYHDLLYTRTVASDFAGHNQPVLFLLLPLYFLFPHPEALFFSRNIALALCAFPAFQLCRLSLPSLPSALLTGAFLLAPAVLFQNFYDYAPLSLIALPLLFALLFYARKRFWLFVLTVFACLLVREDLVFVAVGLGMLALLERRPLRWAILPLALGAAWSVLTWHYLLPHFQHGATSAVQSCFAYLGATPAQMLHTLMSHPRILLTHNIVTYLKLMVTPFGVILPLWSPVALISLPYLFINILGDKGCDAAMIYRHYALIPTVLLLPGVIKAVRWLSTRRSPLDTTATRWAALVLLSSICASLLTIGARELAWWTPSPWNADANTVAASLPAHAAVAVPRYMLPLVANREFVYQSLRLLEYHHPDATYVIIDRDARRSGVSPKTEPRYTLLLQQLSDPGRFRVIYRSANYLVFARTGAPLSSLADQRTHGHE